MRTVTGIGMWLSYFGRIEMNDYDKMILLLAFIAGELIGIALLIALLGG